MDTAKVFKNGRSQAIRLPKAYRLKGDSVYIKKFEDIIVLIPGESPWRSLISSVDDFTEDYMSSRNQPKQQKRKYFNK